MDKVSIIIPIYNSRKHLKECLDSVINQTYKNLEIIIVDDHSTDNSLKLINTYHDKRIHIIKLSKNQGTSIARNKGVEISTGDYLCFLDSDDYWSLDKIQKQVAFMKKNHYSFIYSNYSYLKGNKKKEVHVPKSITYEEALKNTTIFTSTVMFHMKKLKKEDIKMPNIKSGQDTACWWSILKKGIIAYGMNESLSIYRVGERSLSSNKLKAIKRTWNLYKREKLPLGKRIYCFLCYLKNAIKRRI